MSSKPTAVVNVSLVSNFRRDSDNIIYTAFKFLHNVRTQLGLEKNTAIVRFVQNENI